MSFIDSAYRSRAPRWDVSLKTAESQSHIMIHERHRIRPTVRTASFHDFLRAGQLPELLHAERELDRGVVQPFQECCAILHREIPVGNVSRAHLSAQNVSVRYMCACSQMGGTAKGNSSAPGT